jgi:hypothetical protein
MPPAGIPPVGIPPVGHLASGRCFVLKEMFVVSQEDAAAAEENATLPPEEQYRWEDDIEADVREECGKHGVVEDAFIDRSLSVAWVRFADTESAARAAAVMRDKYFDGRRVVVEYKDEGAMTAAVQAGRG